MQQVIFIKPKLSTFLEFHSKLTLSKIEKTLGSFFVNLVKPLTNPFSCERINEIEEFSPYFLEPK